MVRPIEITDALSKSQEVVRLQQNFQHNPEVVEEFQKTVSEREKIRNLTAPVAVPQKDEVVLHVSEEDKEKHQGGRKHPETGENNKKNEINRIDTPPTGHIDIIV